MCRKNQSVSLVSVTGIENGLGSGARGKRICTVELKSELEWRGLPVGRAGTRAQVLWYAVKSEDEWNGSRR